MNKKMWKISMLFLTSVLFLTGCGEMKALDSRQNTTQSQELYSKSATVLTEEATEEISEEDSCQTEEPDFAAIQEKLIEKLTKLLTKLNDTETSDFSEKRLEFHEEFAAHIEEDLTTISAATELTEEFKSIVRRSWAPHIAPPRRGSNSFNFALPSFRDSSCHQRVREGMKGHHCLDLKRILDVTDLFDGDLRESLLARYDELCVSNSNSED